MKYEHVKQGLVGLRSDNRALRLALLLLLLIDLVLTFGYVMRSQIVTITPPDAKGAQIYTRTTANEAALTSWGLYMATLLGNVTPTTADMTANGIAGMLDPSIYKQVMLDVSAQVNKIKVDQLTLSFVPSNVSYDDGKKAVYVSGWLATQDSHGSTNRTKRTYEIWFKVANYQPRIVGLDVYEGDAQMGKKK